MSFSIFTSCALNYLPKARALAQSVRRHQSGARLTLLLNDVVPAWLDLAAEPFDRIWLPQDLGFDRAWIFQHNIMELSTAVKGAALVRLMEEEDAEFHLYLDPDVMLFNALDPIHDYMGDDSIGLIPHILRAEETDIGVELTEMSVTEHGVYNLGHLIIRQDDRGAAFANWWSDRLKSHCFDDRSRGLFTDQRWVDLAPAIFDGVRILRVPNVNVASWNLFGRTIRQNQPGDLASFTVDGLPLITYHFSGSGPLGTHRRIREIFDPANGATAELERVYETAILRNGYAEFRDQPWGFGTFDDGAAISAKARKLFRKHGDLQQAFPDPFDTQSGQATYQHWLQSNKPGLVQGIVLSTAKAEEAFDDLFDEAYYLAAHPDVPAAIESGLYATAQDHYCQIGSSLLLDPNEFFVSSYYFKFASDHDRHILRQHSGTRHGTLLWHYLVSGLQNGSEPIEFFDSHDYLQSNPDLLQAFKTGVISCPLAHYLKHGSFEGRAPGPGFEPETYLRDNCKARDLATEGDVRGGFGAFVRLGGVAGRISA